MDSCSKVIFLVRYTITSSQSSSEDGWTTTHGHFLIKGGFRLVRANDDEVLLDDVSLGLANVAEF